MHWVVMLHQIRNQRSNAPRLADACIECTAICVLRSLDVIGSRILPPRSKSCFSAPISRKLFQRARHQHAVTTKARAWRRRKCALNGDQVHSPERYHDFNCDWSISDGVLMNGQSGLVMRAAAQFPMFAHEGA